MELYYMIGVTERKKSQTLLDICKELNMPMVLTNLARGTATSEQLSLHNLDRSEKGTFVHFILHIHLISHFCVPRLKFLEPKWSQIYS